MNKPQIIICIGTGGVGKTTLAAALGYKYALENKKTLLLTIDPSLRLASTLQIEKNNKIQRIKTLEDLELYGSIIEPEAVFNKFVEKAAENKNIEGKIKANQLYKELSTRLNSSQEFTSLVKLIDCNNSKENYDVIILDTPPAQHIFDFLNAPNKIKNLFNNKLAKVFTREPTFGVTRLMSQGTQKLLQILDKLTGKTFIEELFLFFSSLKTIQEDITEKCVAAKDLLESSNTHFLLISGADINNIEDAKVLSEEMKEHQYKLKQILFNKVAPDWALTEPTDKSNSTQLDEIFDFYTLRSQNCRTFSSQDCQVDILPEINNDLCNLEQIRSIVDRLVHIKIF
ncbi:AAA family ATPase, partial [bacterium]|nr:AAA family ATPase [bacterium]